MVKLPSKHTASIPVPKLNPRDFISLPRRSYAVPNPAGTHALYTLSTYSFDSHTGVTETYVLDFEQNRSVLFSDDPSSKNYSWIGEGSKIVWQKQVDGATEFWIGDAATPGDGVYLASRIEKTFSLLKSSRLSEDTFGLLVLGTPALQRNDLASHEYSTGREYASLPVLEFSGYVTADSQTLWFWSFSKSTPKSDKYSSMIYPLDILDGTDVEFLPYTGPGSMQMGPTNCDLSSSGIVFAGKKRGPYEFRTWTSDLYYLPLPAVSEDVKCEPQKINVPGFSGNVFLPTFSSNSHSIAFLKSKDQKKIVSKNHIFVMTGISKKPELAEVVLTGENQAEAWPLNPEMLLWSSDGEKLYISAADSGRQKVFEISARSTTAKNVSLALFNYGSISGVFRYSESESDHRLLVTRTSFTESSILTVVDTSTKAARIISRLKDSENYGLSSDQISEIWYQGDGDYKVHTWVVRPSYYKKGDKYPLALFIHGGPPQSWLDSWNTRWNPIVFAEQGYTVILPDFTGSPGYGEDFKEAAIRDYGGRPYRDLEKCFEYVEKNVSYADVTRAVALGGSYGGYMILWLAGKALGKKFKALVAHSGSFNTATLYASDEPNLCRVLMGGYDIDPSFVTDIFQKWDPAQYAKNWTTPTLIIHGDKDTRHPVTMGLAAFTTLQLKGVESRYLNFPDEGHFVLKPENSLHWHHTVIGWINKYAGVEGIELKASINERKAEFS